MNWDKAPKPKANRLEDRTTPYWRNLQMKKDQFLVNMGLAFWPTRKIKGKVVEDKRYGPLYEDITDEGAYATFDLGDHVVEWSPAENSAINSGAMTPHDMYIMRANRRIPGLVGK